MENSDEYLPIRRCVCAGITFEELLGQGIMSLEDAAEAGCGINCGRCRPYIQRMLETGQTAFPADLYLADPFR